MRKASFVHAVAVAALVLAASVPSYGQQGETHLGGKPSDLFTLTANNLVGTVQPLLLVGPDGEIGGPFALPAGTVLVVTDLIVAVNGPPAAGITRGGLINQAGTGRTHPGFSFDAVQQGSQTVHVTGGARWSQAPRAINAGDSANAVFITVYGYLAKNK